MESAKIFKSKQVVCGECFTALLTTGGYIYLLGAIGSHVQLRHGQNLHSVLMKRLLKNQAVSTRGLSTPRRQGEENHPYTFPDVSSYFVNYLTAGATFIAALTDDGNALIADDCMDLIRLPSRERDHLHLLVAVNSVLYGQSDSFVYEWREPQLQANTGLLLRNLVLPGRYACPLHTWAGVAFKPDPRLGKVKLANGSADLSAIIAEKAHIEYPLELVGTINPKGRGPYMQEVVERRASITEDEDGLSRVLLRRLRLEQGQQITCIYRLVTQRMRWGLSLVQEFATHKEVAKRTYRIAMMPTVLSKTMYRLRLAQLGLAWSGLRWSESVSPVSGKKMLNQGREEAVRNLVRLLSTMEAAVSYKAAFALFSLHSAWRLRRRSSQTALTMLRHQALKAVTGLQRQALRQWSNYVIRLHIQAQGVEKLLAVIRANLQYSGLKVMRKYAGDLTQRTKVLGRLLRRMLSQRAHIALLRAVGKWKLAGHRRSTSHYEALHTSCRILAGRLKLLLKGVYRSAFPQIQSYAYSRSWEQTNRVQLVCLVSVLSKVRCRYLSSIFHSRLQPRTNYIQVTSALVPLQALRLSRLRTALGLIAQCAVARWTHRAFRLGLALSRAQDRLSRLHMRLFFAENWVSLESEASFSPITPYSEWRRSFPSVSQSKTKLTLPFAHWDSLSDHKEYYCPEDVPAFLNEDAAGDCSKPAELEGTPSLTPRMSENLPRPHLEMSGSQHSSFSALSLLSQGYDRKYAPLHKRPPWRAPQPTGASPIGTSSILATANSPRSRRLQYSESLKTRMQQNRRKQPAGSPSKSQRRGSTSTMTDERCVRPDLPDVLALLFRKQLRVAFLRMYRPGSRRNVRGSEGDAPNWAELRAQWQRLHNRR